MKRRLWRDTWSSLGRGDRVNFKGRLGEDWDGSRKDVGWRNWGALGVCVETQCRGNVLGSEGDPGEDS